MDARLLIEENFHTALTLISSRFYRIAEDKSEIQFHDENCYELFFLHLNEYINTEFTSPLDNKSRYSLFELTTHFSKIYDNNDYFKKFVDAGNSFNNFLFSKRIYNKYISPYEIKIETSIAELINIQSNYTKHSLYHLSQMKNKLKRIFLSNGIENIPDEEFNEHLRYFKEVVLDDRLNFNQTKIVEEIGKYFLSLYNLVNCGDNVRIRMAIDDWILKNGRDKKWKIDPPTDMTDAELFHWEIKGLSCWRFDKVRLIDLIPRTAVYLIEK